MKHKQAIELFNALTTNVVRCNDDSERDVDLTKLGVVAIANALPIYLATASTRLNETQSKTTIDNRHRVAAFFREWADAIEESFAENKGEEMIVDNGFFVSLIDNSSGADVVLATKEFGRVSMLASNNVATFCNVDRLTINVINPGAVRFAEVVDRNSGDALVRFDVAAPGRFVKKGEEFSFEPRSLVFVVPTDDKSLSVTIRNSSDTATRVIAVT